MAEHPGAAKGLVPEGYAIFEGYASELEEGQEAVLEKGDPVKIVRFEGEADIVVVKVDEDGNEVTDADGTPIAERCFAEELAPAVDDSEETSEAAEEAGDAAEETTDEGSEEAEETADEQPLAGKTFAADASVADLRKLATDNGQKATGRSASDVKASLIAMGATEEAAAEEPAAEEKTEAKAPATRKAPAAKAETKKDVKAPAVVEISDMASVTDAISSEGGDALKAAKALIERRDRTDFTLGGVLRNIHESGVYKTLGYDGKRGFDEYVEQTLGIQPRKARYLMGIYEAFAMLGIADIEARLEAIGWSKAKEMARIPTPELKRDFNKLEKKANEDTRDKLVEHIKSKYTVATRNTGDQVKLTDFRFRLAEEDAKVAEDALAAATKLTGEGDDLNKAFLYVMGEFLNTGTGQDLDLEQALELLGSRFGAQSIKFTDAEGEEVEWTPDEETSEAEADEEETLPATEEA